MLAVGQAQVATHLKRGRAGAGEADQLQAVESTILRQSERAFTDVVTFLRGRRFAPAYVIRDSRAVGIRADMDEALFHTKVQQRVHSVRFDSERSGGLE